MMIKVILSVCIICLSTFTGYLIASSYDQRIKQISAFIYSVKLMEAEMNYSRNYILDILKKLSYNNEPCISNFFKKISEEIQKNNGKDFSAIWNDSIYDSFSSSSFSTIDLKLINDLGKSIGKMDLENQQKIFTYFYKRLELQLEDAVNEKTKKSRVYKNLGIAAGVMIVVVLI